MCGMAGKAARDPDRGRRLEVGGNRCVRSGGMARPLLPPVLDLGKRLPTVAREARSGRARAGAGT
eukprot:8421676-Alexandrium_andersonii.AAC.1